MFCLTSQTGASKGSSWSIAGDKLVIGRGRDCSITVRDSLVSRHHCEITEVDSGVMLTDLGSRNATLVNGRPVSTCELRTGDEIAVGRAVFLVTSTDRETPNASAPSDSTTVNLAEDVNVFMGSKTAELVAKAYPNSVIDLASLYDLGRKFSRCLSVHELIRALFLGLDERFEPSSQWIALKQADEELTFYSRDRMKSGQAVTPPTEILRKVRKVLTRHEGLIIPVVGHDDSSPRLATLLVAPIGVATQQVGVVLLRCEAQTRVCTDNDLQFLSAVAATVAPYFGSVEQMEQLRRDNDRLRALAGRSINLVGKSRSIGQVRSLIRKAAPTDLSVLIRGETGTGKELVAQMVHELSNRASGELVTVNCAAIPAQLFESELFGHEKGAFTSADQLKIGLIEQANGGTLFLDEVGDLTLDNQAKLLRVIETGKFFRVGADHESHSDFRVISATNKDIPAMVREGKFREDLYHRVNGFEIVLPPLREHPSDIPLLAQHFFDLARAKAKRPLGGFTEQSLTYLSTRRWPGNVRQLRNTIDRAISLARSEKIDIPDLQSHSEILKESLDPTPTKSLAQIEKEHIEAILRQCHGRVNEAAQILGIGRSTLYAKINEYGIRLA